MRHDFAPLKPDAVAYLQRMVGVDFSAIDFRSPSWFCVTTRDDDGTVMGVAVFEFKNPFDAWMTLAVSDVRALDWAVAHATFKAVFSQAARITAEVEPGNQRALAQMQGMGFEIEGFRRNAIDGHRDAFMFGMVKDTCPFLERAQRGRLRPQRRKSEGHHGQHAEST